MLPRAQAWQHIYVLNTLIKCDGDHGRLLAAAMESHRKAAAQAHRGAKRVGELNRAADLCKQAARIIADAGADHDDKTRRRLIAGCEHETMMRAMGRIPEIAHTSSQDLLDTLRDIDDEP